MRQWPAVHDCLELFGYLGGQRFVGSLVTSESAVTEPVGGSRNADPGLLVSLAAKNPS